MESPAAPHAASSAPGKAGSALAPVVDSVLDLIGNTPMLRVSGVC